jgi:hypothetical protein
MPKEGDNFLVSLRGALIRLGTRRCGFVSRQRRYQCVTSVSKVCTRMGSGQLLKSFILLRSLNWYQPRVTDWESKVSSTAGVTVLARLPEARCMSESPSLTSPAACYRAVCEAWSVYGLEYSITLPYPPRRSPLLPMCVQSMKLAACLL